MPRTCACCAHPHRTEIDARIVAGSSVRDVAGAFGLRPAAVHRHVQNHLTRSLQTAAEQAAATSLQPVATRRPPRAIQLDPIDHEASAPAPAQITATAPAAEGVAALAAIAPLNPFQLACELRDSAVSILRRASASGDGKLALDANRAAVNVLDRLARLMPATGSAAAPLHQSEEWHRARAALITALQPFPEARVAVATALAELEAAP